MTTYEKIAITLSIIAILIPIIQWMWKKWVIKPKLKFYSTGRAYLFMNKSGSYIRVEGVYEALNKPIAVKEISIVIKRMKDNLALNLKWGTFCSPINQQIVGMVSSSTEIAHPFRVDANNVACAFVEFTDFYNTSWKNIKEEYDELINDIAKINLKELAYNQAYDAFVSLEKYKNVYNIMLKELFWDIGQYEAVITAKHDNKVESYLYKFGVSKLEKDALISNIQEVLVYELKEIYRVPHKFESVQVEFEEKVEAN